MTDAETEDVEDDEELPEIDDEEMADADLDALAEEVEAETAPDADEEESEGDGDEDELEPAAPGGSNDSWGDMYVGTLVSVSNAIIDEFGTEDAEQVEEELARQLHLDEYFDEWMSQRGKPDMPPEQAILIGTTMFLVVVIGTKTDLVSQLLEEADI